MWSTMKEAARLALVRFVLGTSVAHGAGAIVDVSYPPSQATRVP